MTPDELRQEARFFERQALSLVTRYSPTGPLGEWVRGRSEAFRFVGRELRNRAALEEGYDVSILGPRAVHRAS